MIPRFANPHLLQQSTQTVSRADLETEHDVYHPEADEDDIAVSTLERILKRSLGNLQDDYLESAEDTKHRKKRRKTKSEVDEGSRTIVDERLVEFRLLSKATKMVSLNSKPPPQITVTGPSLEDDDDQAALRADQASAVAVDAAWIFEESQKPYNTRRNAGKVVALTADKPFTLARLMMFELPKPVSSPAPSINAHLSVSRNGPLKVHPNPHEFVPDKICCPIIPAALSHTEPSSYQRKHRSRTRHKKHPAEPKPPPSFWRPLQEWGGKSRGYAMGYEGSRSVPTGSVRQWRYRRDTMKKGTFCA